MFYQGPGCPITRDFEGLESYRDENNNPVYIETYMYGDIEQGVLCSNKEFEEMRIYKEIYNA